MRHKNRGNGCGDARGNLAPRRALSTFDGRKSVKYCDTCNLWKRKQDNRFNAAEHRRRKKKMNKLKDERLQLYAEENKALRQLIMQLREQIH